MPKLTEDQKRQVLFAATRSDGQGVRRVVNRMIDAQAGDHANDALSIMLQVMHGTLIARARAPNPGEDAQSYALTVPLVYPSIQQRFEAAKAIFEQRNGKPRTNDATLNLNSNGEASVSVPISTDDMSEDELLIARSLVMSARTRQEKTIEGTATTPGSGTP